MACGGHAGNIFLYTEIMYLSAISIGYAVPSGNFDASVHSVFQSALNLRWHASDTLLTLLASGEANLPQGIRLDAPKDFTFEIFSEGEKVTCRDGTLQLNAFTIDLCRARRWECDLPALKIDTTNPAVAAAWSFVWGALNRRQKLSNAEIIAEDLLRHDEAKPIGIARKACEAMRNLVSTAQRYDLADTSAIKSLIGLGSGLTPSGDDLLAGFMSGLWCTVRDQSEQIKFVSDLGRVIIHQSEKTNDISRTYLYHAVQGQVSSRLADLAGAISRGETPNHLADIAEAAMQVGHTSGMDTVTGLLIGLTAWVVPNKNS